MSDLADGGQGAGAVPAHPFAPGREAGGLRQALADRLTGWSLSSLGKLWMAHSPDRGVSIQIEEHRDRPEEWVLEVRRGADLVLHILIKTGQPFPAAARDAALVLMTETGLTPDTTRTTP